MNAPGSRLDIPGGPAWRKQVEERLTSLHQTTQGFSGRLDNLRQVVLHHNARILQAEERLRQLEQQSPS